VLFAVHILVIDHFSFVDGVRMSCIQFFAAGIICMIGMFLFETPDVSAMMDAAVPILYAGCLSSGAGYTLQIIGQKDADPAVASMLLSLESVFAALSGFVLLHQELSSREIFGCALIFAAVLIAQMPNKTKKQEA
jgi:drug/metabolite transporter (DMT)-like permease